MRQREFTTTIDGEPVTEGEREKLMELRLEALAAATAHATQGQLFPVAWRRGWKAFLHVVSRDRRGHLLASVTCTGPQLRKPYIRRARLVPEHRLNVR